MAIRLGPTVHVYLNACPHIGLTLDVVPGRFLNRERTHILCANHGALFWIEDGACVAGPCRGAHLTLVPAVVHNGLVFVAPAR